MVKFEISPIGKIYTPYKKGYQAPRQTVYSKGAEGIIEIFEEYKDGIDGIERFEYIIVLFYFDRMKGYHIKEIPHGSASTRGVFSTRSPRRPNHIGFSILKLIGVDGRMIKVKDVDILDGTPIIDIKPYVSDIDSK